MQSRQQDAERGNRKQKTESGDSCQHGAYWQGDEPSQLTASGCERGSLTWGIHTCSDTRKQAGKAQHEAQREVRFSQLGLCKTEIKSWVCRSVRQEEKKASFLWSLGEKWNNIVAGLAPGSARGQTAQGGCEFMKTAEDVAAMAGLKCFSSNLKGGLCASVRVLTCFSSPLYWHLSRHCAFLSLFLYQTP